MFTSIKKNIRSFPSPIRWGWVGIAIAITLFSFEIALSFYYLSPFGENIMDLGIVFKILCITFGSLSILTFIILGIVGLIWLTGSAKDDTADRTVFILNKVNSIERKFERKLDKLIKTIRQDRNERKDRAKL
ncbi:hypothetical protein ACFLVG_05805 [Chloroflexota bacterium]